MAKNAECPSLSSPTFLFEMGFLTDPVAKLVPCSPAVFPAPSPVLRLQVTGAYNWLRQAYYADSEEVKPGSPAYTTTLVS